MDIKDNIKALRIKYKLTQTELGKIAGVSDKAVSTWEKGNALPRMGALHPIVVSELSEHRERQRAEMSRYHYKTDYVFTTHTGRLLDYSDVRRSLDRLYQRIGNDAETGCFTPHKFHAFRATFCTNLRKSGVSLETACALMGHSSVQVTADYYSAVTGADLRDAIMGQSIKALK